MYQIIDAHTGKVVFEALTERTAEIRLNALQFTTQFGPDRDRYVMRYNDDTELGRFFKNISVAARFN